MSYVESDNPRGSPQPGNDWQRGYARPAFPRSSGGPPWGMLLTGLAVVGLGVLAWNYLGPDLRRYIKISTM